MNTVFSPEMAIRGVFNQPARGLVGMADDLLTVCREHDLELDWRTGCCRVRSRTGSWHEVADVPLGKSAFRGLLARLAALCNERHQDSCSPYGGQGEIMAGRAVFRVVFTNTPGEQRLQLALDRGAPSPTWDDLMTNQLDPQPAFHPAFGALLDNVPRLRSPGLWGWTHGFLLPALDAFHENASEAEVADATVKLKQVLLDRADVETWLAPIAEQCSGEFAGFPHAMTSASKLKPSIALPDDRTKNYFTLEAARQLREALRPPLVSGKPTTPPASTSHENRS
jgi:hypothetical protein